MTSGQNLMRLPSTVRRAVVLFLVASAVATVVVFLAAGVISDRVAEQEVSTLAGDATVSLAAALGKRVTPELRAGDALARQQFDDLVAARIDESSVVRVKIWSRDGEVLYASGDAAALIGQRFELEEDDRLALETDLVESEVSDVSKPENRFERQFAPVVEVYVGGQDSQGEDVLVETYFTVDRLAERKAQLASTIAPAVLIPLLLLLVLVLPLGVSLLRRVARQEAERNTLVRLAAEASASERRKMAGELHDGVIQDLSGVGYALAVVEGRLSGDSDIDEGSRSDMLGTVRTTLDVIRGDVASLRGIITSLYTSAVDDVDLGAALLAVAADARAVGITVLDDVHPVPPLPPATTAGVFQVGREALRNALEHADATVLRLELSERDGVLVLLVADDGLGFDPAARIGPADGHLGMSLMHDSAAAVGGTLEVSSVPGTGTHVRLSVPLTARRGRIRGALVPRPAASSDVTPVG